MLTRFDPLSDPFFAGALLGNVFTSGAGRAHRRRRGADSAGPEDHKPTFSPPVDIWEDDTELTLTAELAGLGEDEIEVEVEDRRLTLRGSRQPADRGDQEGQFTSERNYGNFERTFRLPPNVDVANIEATMAQGVLTLRLPKKPESLPRKIPIGAKSQTSDA